MQNVKMAVALGAATIGFSGLTGYAAIAIDGTLDASYGSALAVQTNTSNSRDFELGDPARTNASNQLSNAYGKVEGGKLDLFFGGAINLNNERLVIVIDANSTAGVADLTGQTMDAAANLANVKFDSGFRPETLIQAQFNGGNIFYVSNLLNGTQVKDDYSTDPRGTVVQRGPAYSDPAGGPNFSVADDTSNEGTLITSNFASVNKGYEMQFDLADLGYNGGNVNVSAFLTYGGNNHISNQILGTSTNTGEYNFDFTSADHPGNQYFTVAVPEPASLGAIGLLAGVALRRRSR